MVDEAIEHLPRWLISQQYYKLDETWEKWWMVNIEVKFGSVPVKHIAVYSSIVY